MENIIYNELAARGLKVDVGVINTRETIDGKQKSIPREIDFVVTSRSRKCYIQSVYAMSDEKKRNIEVKPYPNATDFLFYGTDDKGQQASKPFRWNWGRSYTTQLIDDFNYVLAALIALKKQRERSIHQSL